MAPVRSGEYGFDYFEHWVGTGDHNGFRYFDEARGAYVANTEYNATTMASHAIGFIKKHHKNSFLLMVSMHPPHSDYFDAPARFKNLYAGKKLDKRPDYSEELDTPYDL